MPSLFGQNSERKIFMTGNNTGSFFGFEDLFAGYGYQFFCYAPLILVMHPFFRNEPPKYYNVSVHYKKWAHNKKKLVPVTCKVPRNPKQEPLLFPPSKFLTGVGDLNYKTTRTVFGLTVIRHGKGVCNRIHLSFAIIEIR